MQHARPRHPVLPNPLRSARGVLPSYISAPTKWGQPATGTECTLHQLAPYIGKLKSTIARDLVSSFSKRGDLVVDPFSGSGTIPLESLLLGRRVFASDIGSYAATLTRAKIAPPDSEEGAIRDAQEVFEKAEASSVPDLRSVPSWVRAYFHPKTLKETLAFVRICRREKRHFLLACVLGILHHQRPGFLSFPSSHLVPYLRDHKFPRTAFPEMYFYRELMPRLIAKIRRALRRVELLDPHAEFSDSAVEDLLPTFDFDAMITSPPYMNALDYGRDNRLRLWFLDEHLDNQVNADANSSKAAFLRQITSIARLNEARLNISGYCVLVVGESVGTSRKAVHPAQAVLDLFNTHAPSLVLRKVVVDRIPDVRRSRRDCRGVKQEQIIVFRKERVL